MFLQDLPIPLGCLPRDALLKMLRLYIRADLVKNLRFVRKPGEQKFFIPCLSVFCRCPCAAPVFLCRCLPCGITDPFVPDLLRGTRSSVGSCQPSEPAFIHVISSGCLFQIILPLDLIADPAQLCGDRVMELSSLCRVIHGIVAALNPQLIEKAVLCIADPLFKSLRAEGFDEFVRVLLGRKIDHSRLDPGSVQDTDAPERGAHAGGIAVIGKEHLRRIPLDQCRLPLGKRRSQRGDRLVETGLVHGDHIHVTLTQYFIRRLRPLCDVKSVQIPALVEDLRLGRVEILGFGVTHYAAAETNHLSPHIHDRKDHAVPELVVHPSLFVKSSDAGFQDDLILKTAASQMRHKIIS